MYRVRLTYTDGATGYHKQKSYESKITALKHAANLFISVSTGTCANEGIAIIDVVDISFQGEVMVFDVIQRYEMKPVVKP